MASRLSASNKERDPSENPVAMKRPSGEKAGPAESGDSLPSDRRVDVEIISVWSESSRNCGTAASGVGTGAWLAGFVGSGAREISGSFLKIEGGTR